MASETTTRDPPLGERERVLRLMHAHQAEPRALGVSRLWLLGSLARGDAGRGSDVDVLISVAPTRKFSLLDLAEVRAELCELLGRDTDVVIREDALPRLWARIRDDLVEVFRCREPRSRTASTTAMPAGAKSGRLRPASHGMAKMLSFGAGRGGPCRRHATMTPRRWVPLSPAARRRIHRSTGSGP